jgi:AraC-like DNA-binding protein
MLQICNKLGASVELNQLMNPGYEYRGNQKDKNNFNKVFGFILANYSNRIKISDVAELIGLNDTAFSHYFRKRSGKSFTDYLTELRLLKADAMILRTHRKIARICSECGFHNLSNFNRIYKNWKGMSPAQARKSPVRVEH